MISIMKLSNYLKNLFIIVFSSLLIISNISFAKSGCCSWHQGVKRCDKNTGRIVCNDETYSPSCMCEPDSKNSKFRPSDT